MHRIEPSENFTPSWAPASFNSEPSVVRFLGQLVYYKRARTIIELGCFVGWATAHMALALQARDGGRIHCVDPSQEYLDVMKTNLRRHGLHALVAPVRGFSLDQAVLAELPLMADVIFLDTCHAYPVTRDEILTYAPRLAPGGCFVLHDSISAPGVRRSLQEIASRFRVHTFATEQSNGVTVLMHD
jgi:predicted O-methyltransferase YrrM